MLTKLSREQLAARSEYVTFLQGLAVGEGGMGTVAGEGASKFTLKNRLNAAENAAGVMIKFRRSDENAVIFDVVSRETDPITKPPYTGKRRGRKPKSAA